jgi:hypothetical protein
LVEFFNVTSVQVQAIELQRQRAALQFFFSAALLTLIFLVWLWLIAVCYYSGYGGLAVLLL